MTYPKPNRRRAFVLVVALIAIYFLVPSLGVFKRSFTTLENADKAYILIAMLLVGLTYLWAALSYQWLAINKLKFRDTLLIQISTGFSNRLLPAGTGGLVLNDRYLLRTKHSHLQSAAIVAINNMLGFIGDGLLVVVLIFLGRLSTNDLLKGKDIKHYVPIALTLSIALLITYILYAHKKGYLKSLVNISRQVKQIINRPYNMMLVLVASILITISFVTALFCVALAFNIHINVSQFLVIYIIGVVIASMTPTPGGLGGAEAALTGLIALAGVATPQALAAALTYRFLTYWLPIIPGYLGFHLAIKRKLV